MTKGHALRQWGMRLARLRENAGLSGGKVVEKLLELGIKVDRRTIYAYEAGRIAAPDAGVVWGLAGIYNVDTADLIARLVACRTGRLVTTAEKDAPLDEWVKLSIEERKLFTQLRCLPARKRQTCLDFVAFQTGGRSTPTSNN